MRRAMLLSLALVPCIYAPAPAQEAASDTVTQVSPIFSQLVLFAFPQGFKTVYEKADGNRYIREFVPAGETVDQWTEMITVTGAKGLAGNVSVTPELFVTQLAVGFKHACPDTFLAKRMGAAPISGHQAIIVVLGCGTVITGVTPRSEAALIIAIKGAADYYTLKWAERGAASAHSLDLGDPKWADRLKKLSPIRICPLVPGEAPPYPSCVNQK